MIKFADVSVRDEITHQAVKEVLETGQFIQGKWNKEFDKRWAQYCGTKFSIGVASGNAALISCLKYLKTKSDNNLVVVPTYSFAATVFAVVEAKCKPIYCPVDGHGLMQIDKCNFNSFEGILAILPVHLYGQQLEIPEEITSRVAVIEDACQAHGLKKLQGQAACFSFYPAKNLGCAGDAGSVITDDEEMANWIRAYINYGDFPGQKYIHSMVGNNLRMDNLQACILAHKLPYLDEQNQRRQEIAKLYFDNGVEPITSLDSVFHQFPILVENQEYFANLMKEKGIQTGCHYPYTLPEIYKSFSFDLSEDKSEEIANRVVTLPIWPTLTNNEILQVCDIIKSHYQLEFGVWYRQ
jgi:dTDP-4-amino-4,6-dideoxygalactose transaminase